MIVGGPRANHPPGDTRRSRCTFAPDIATKVLDFAWTGPKRAKLPMRPRPPMSNLTQGPVDIQRPEEEGGVMDVMDGPMRPRKGLSDSALRAVCPRDPLFINTFIYFRRKY